jgi:hypothetical protein
MLRKLLRRSHSEAVNELDDLDDFDDLDDLDESFDEG